MTIEHKKIEYKIKNSYAIKCLDHLQAASTMQHAEETAQAIEYLHDELKSYEDEREQKRKYDTRYLVDSFIEDLENDKDAILESEYPEDLISEYADNNVPIYNWDLAQYLASDFNLAYPDEPDCANKEYGIFGVIMWSIYELLSQAGYEWLENARQEREDTDDESEDE